MGEFLRNLALLAAVAAAGGVALLKAVSPPPPAPVVPAPMVVDRTWTPPAIHSPISFAALGAGEQIRVRFGSQGCFHDFEGDLVFERARSGGAVVFDDTRRPNLAPSARGTIALRLSPVELRELDTQLAYLRLPRRDGCTTRDQVDLALYRDGVLAVTEHFVDESCGFRPDNNALTFGGLLRLVTPSPW